jgi:NAD(P)-dependent dehydrogenase (short-subunit alcohol dehydrogenase family)
MNNNMEDKSKVALVTGGSRGLGKNMALKLADKGINVVITYHSKEQEALEVVAEIQQKGLKAAALKLDAGDIKSVFGFLGRLNVVLKCRFNAHCFEFLINHAGIGRNELIEKLEEDVFDELLNVHFKGVYFLTQKALPLLNDGGGIINISTGLSRIILPRYSAYGSIKSAVETFTKYLAVELGDRKIRANVVAPGAIATDFSGGHVRDNEQVNQTVSGMTALGRAGLPEDIGGVVAFLCTRDAGWINAQRIEVSGGMRI